MDKEKEPHKNEVLTKKDFYGGVFWATCAIIATLNIFMSTFTGEYIYLIRSSLIVLGFSLTALFVKSL